MPGCAPQAAATAWTGLAWPLRRLMLPGTWVPVLQMLLGPILSATATTLNMMVAGRFLAGLAIGLSSALVPVYISEVSPTAVRGTLGSMNQLMICLGILAALLVNVVLPVDAWRTMFMVAAAPAAVLFVGKGPCRPGLACGSGRSNLGCARLLRPPAQLASCTDDKSSTCHLVACLPAPALPASCLPHASALAYQ